MFFLELLIFVNNLTIRAFFYKIYLIANTKYGIVLEGGKIMKIPEVIKTNAKSTMNIYEKSSANSSSIPHLSIESERIFMSCIKDGNIKRYYNLFSFAENTGKKIGVGILSTDNLKHAKYLAVVFITLAIRSAIDGGMPEIDAFEFSDKFINEIDTYDDISKITSKAFSSFEELIFIVHDIKENQADNPTIKACKKYINTHIYSKISLNELAEYCKRSPSYLSAVFKDETGITISGYILLQKIESAKDLLATTSYSFVEITNMLGFCSQSRFIECFKKVTGTTPKKYKRSIMTENSKNNINY